MVKKTLQITLLLVLGLLVLIPSARANDESGLSPEEIKRLEIKKRIAAMRLENSGIYTFERADGDKVYTNRPQKYRQRQGFVEVDFQTIRIPPPKVQDTSLADVINYYSKLYNVKENLIYAVIRSESNFQVTAKSHAGASGLMQLMPETAKEMGVSNIYDPVQNIGGGTQYLGKMLEIFDGNTQLALAAYNAGPNAVKQHGGVPPYRETQNYIESVLRHEKRYQQGGSREKLKDLARVDGAVVLPPARGQRVQRAPEPKKERYLVYFHSGITQPADKVEDREPFYYIEYRKRTFPVRKDLIRKIVEAA